VESVLRRWQNSTVTSWCFILHSDICLIRFLHYCIFWKETIKTRWKRCQWILS
jgi:hypothetical protein